jgi:hypothetical protein
MIFCAEIVTILGSLVEQCNVAALFYKRAHSCTPKSQITVVLLGIQMKVVYKNSTNELYFNLMKHKSTVDGESPGLLGITTSLYLHHVRSQILFEQK